MFGFQGTPAEALAVVVKLLLAPGRDAGPFGGLRVPSRRLAGGVSRVPSAFILIFPLALLLVLYVQLVHGPVAPRRGWREGRGRPVRAGTPASLTAVAPYPTPGPPRRAFRRAPAIAPL